MFFFFFQAEDGIRDLVRSRGLGDVYKRQGDQRLHRDPDVPAAGLQRQRPARDRHRAVQRGRAAAGVQLRARLLHGRHGGCLLYTSDAADERSSVDLGGRRIIKKKKERQTLTQRPGMKQEHR